mgnify:CR=1 FL=1
MEHLCLVCKKPLIKRDHESEPRFQAKRFDSAECARIWLKQNKQGWWQYNKTKEQPYEKEE